LILHCAKSGEEQTNQDRNDRNHYEQLDECERLSLATLRPQLADSDSIQEFHLVARRLKKLKRLKKAKRSIFFNLVIFTELLEHTGRSGEIAKVFHRHIFF
jgi:hypothetical protein